MKEEMASMSEETALGGGQVNNHGAQLSYFCPKRFNRFPRFTIYFNKDQEEEQNPYIMENTVSLNAEFLSYLVDK